MNPDDTTPDPRDGEGAGGAKHDAPTAEHDAPTAEHDAPGPPPAPPVRQLLRYPEKGPGAGVAAGLGVYFGVDPVLFRIAFVLLSFAGGAGILLYLVAWAVMPEAPAHTSPAANAAQPGPSDRTLQWIGIGLVVFAGLWLSARLDLVSGPVLWAVVLIVVGVLLFRGDLPGPGRTGTGQPPPPASHDATAPPPPRPGGAPAPREAPPPAWGAAPPASPPPSWSGAAPPSGGPPPGGPAAGWSPPAESVRPTPPPQHVAAAEPAPPASPLGRLTAGVVLLAGGGAALLDTAGVLDLTFRHYAALTLLVVGLGLLVGTWWGRSRGLVAAGLVLLPLVLLAGVADTLVTVRGGVGERFFSAADVSEVRESYELFAGRMQIDLSEVDFAGTDVDVRGRVALGEILVVVPEGVAVGVDAAVGGGEVRLPPEAEGGGFAPDRPVSGLRVERRATLGGESGGGTLDLELTSGLGTITVRRVP